jgi:hypothetical protein
VPRISSSFESRTGTGGLAAGSTSDLVSKHQPYLVPSTGPQLHRARLHIRTISA